MARFRVDVWKSLIWAGVLQALRSKKSIGVVLLLVLPLLIGGVAINSPGSFSATQSAEFREKETGLKGEMLLPLKVLKNQTTIVYFNGTNHLDSSPTITVDFSGAIVKRRVRWELAPQEVFNKTIPFSYAELKNETLVNVMITSFSGSYGGMSESSDGTTWFFEVEKDSAPVKKPPYMSEKFFNFGEAARVAVSIDVPDTIYREQDAVVYVSAANRNDTAASVQVNLTGAGAGKGLRLDLAPRGGGDGTIVFSPDDLLNETSLWVNTTILQGTRYTNDSRRWLLSASGGPGGEPKYSETMVKADPEKGTVVGQLYLPQYIFWNRSAVVYLNATNTFTNYPASLRVNFSGANLSMVYLWDMAPREEGNRTINFPFAGFRNETMVNITVTIESGFEPYTEQMSWFPYVEREEKIFDRKPFSFESEGGPFLGLTTYFPQSISTNEPFEIAVDAYSTLPNRTNITFDFTIADKKITRNVTISPNDRSTFSWRFEPWDGMPVGSIDTVIEISVPNATPPSQSFRQSVEITDRSIRPYYSTQIFLFMFANIYLRFFLLFPLLILAGMVMEEDMEKKRIHFLVTKTLRRHEVYLLKFATYVVSAALVVSLTILLLYMIVFSYSSMAAGLDVLGVSLLAGFLAVLAFGALFFLLTLVTKRAMMVGAFYLFIFELFLGSLQFDAQRLTISYPLRSVIYSMLSSKGDFLADLLGLRVGREIIALDAGAAVGAALFVTALLLALGTYIFSRKELP